MDVLGITVKELHSMCAEEMKKGNGDKYILVIEDKDTGQGYHNLDYGFITDKEVLERIIWIIEEQKYTIDNCVALV